MGYIYEIYNASTTILYFQFYSINASDWYSYGSGEKARGLTRRYKETTEKETTDTKETNNKPTWNTTEIKETI